MADFLTRLAERTLNRVPVAQPMIASIFAPEPTLSGFSQQAEAWSPLEQTQEVTTVSPAVPEIEVQSAINERQEVPTPFTPITLKPSPIIAEQEEQAGAKPTVISQDKAAKPGRRGDHKGQPNIGETDTGVQGDYQSRSYNEESGAGVQGDYQSRSYNEESGAGVQGDHKGRPYNDESSAIPSQRLIADQPAALTEQLSLYPAPAAPGLPVEENEPGIAARHEATDPIRMKIEHSEIVSPVADIASLIEARAGIPPREASIISRDEDMVLPIEVSNGEEDTYTMARQRISPGEERPSTADVGGGFHRQAESPHAPVHFHDDSYSRGPAAIPQGDHKGPLPSSAPLPPLLAESLFPKKPIPEGVELSRPRALLRTVDQPARTGQNWQPDALTGRNAEAAPMQIIQRSTGSEQSASFTNASVPGEVEAYTIGQLISSSMQNSSQPPEQHLLVPHVQAQQGMIASQETELTSVEGNNSDPTITRSQRYSPIEQERNNRLLAEQHSVLPAAETTQAAPTIHVTIGRIDVRAIPGPAPAPSSKPAKRSPALSLDDYLKQGKGGRQ